MGVETSNEYTAVFDARGRWVFGVGPLESLPTAGIPDGSLAWDPKDSQLLKLSSGAWASAAMTVGAMTTGVLTGSLTGNVTGNVTGDVTGQVVHNDNVRSKRIRVTLAQLNAGYTLLAAVAGYGYRIIDMKMIAVGGALGTATSIEIEGNQAGAVDLFSVAAAQLTRSAVNGPGIAGTTVLADGASFAVCSDNTAITISATGTADTLTNVDVILTYTLET